MSPEAHALLSLTRLPAILSAEAVGWLLGLQTHEVVILTRSRHLLALGKPRRGPKRFATVHILSHSNDAKWLGRSTDIIAAHWRKRNNAAEGSES